MTDFIGMAGREVGENQRNVPYQASATASYQQSSLDIVKEVVPRPSFYPSNC